MKEVDVGKAVVTLLREEGWEVYQEVQTPWGDILDLAATRGPLLIAVELKITPSYEVMEQALRWMPYAHQCFVGAPVGRYGAHPLCLRLMESLGLGFIEVRDGYAESLEGDLSLVAGRCLDPRLNRHPTDRLRKCLREEHKTFAQAGSSGAARWSPYKATCQELAKFVKNRPGCSLKEAVEGIRHHYSSARSARSSLVGWIEKNKIVGVHLERVGKELRLYPRKP